VLGVRRGFPFPLGVDADGFIAPPDDDDVRLRGKIIQVLFTAPGERVNLPTFGCGLLDLVFEPNDGILASATEFTVGQALTRWLRDEIAVDRVQVGAEDERMLVEVSYTRLTDLRRQTIRVRFR
jgi:phage baseplate assembly protein W